VGNACRVKDCVTTANLGDGIAAGSDCTIKDCTAVSNFQRGIRTGDRSVIRSCTANLNSNEGILVTSKCMVVDNLTADNNASGVPRLEIHSSGDANRIEGNVCAQGIGVGDGVKNLVVRNQFSFVHRNNIDNQLGLPYVQSGYLTDTIPWANFGH